MISQYQTWSKSCLLVLGPHDIQRCSGPDCMPRDIGHGTRLGAWSSPVLRRASAGDILWLKASPNWNWQNFGDQWGKFLHFLGRTRIPGWKNILFSWLQTVWHSTGLTRSVDPDFVRNAEVWIDPGGSRSHLWRRWKPAIPTPKLAPLILVDLLHPPEIGWHFQKNNHVNGTKPAMGAAMRILCFTDITSFSWNPLKANCDQTVEPFFWSVFSPDPKHILLIVPVSRTGLSLKQTACKFGDVVILMIYPILSYCVYIMYWLVVSTPLKNMKVSWAYYSQYMESHKIHVPNHQSVYILCP